MMEHVNRHGERLGEPILVRAWEIEVGVVGRGRYVVYCTYGGQGAGKGGNEGVEVEVCQWDL